MTWKGVMQACHGHDMVIWHRHVTCQLIIMVDMGSNSCRHVTCRCQWHGHGDHYWSHDIDMSWSIWSTWGHFHVDLWHRHVNDMVMGVINDPMVMSWSFWSLIKMVEHWSLLSDLWSFLIIFMIILAMINWSWVIFDQFWSSFFKNDDFSSIFDEFSSFYDDFIIRPLRAWF